MSGAVDVVGDGSSEKEEFLWTCTLTGADKEYIWSPEDPVNGDEDDNEAGLKPKPSHRLLIKNAVLLSAAKEHEVTVVQVETEGYNKTKVVVPIVAMKAGRDLQTYIDVLLPGRAKLSLLQGEGPIQLVGRHCVDFGGYGDAGDESDEDDEAEEKIDDEEKEELTEDAGKKAPATERTFIMVKPDGVQRGLVGEIMSRFEKKGFRLVGIKFMKASKERLEEHYADLAELGFFTELVTYMASGPVCPMVWEGLHAVETGRKMLGETDPGASLPGTIRGDYADVLRARGTSRNVCHGSHDIDSANREIALWFEAEEMTSWTSMQMAWNYV